MFMYPLLLLPPLRVRERHKCTLRNLRANYLQKKVGRVLSANVIPQSRHIAFIAATNSRALCLRVISCRWAFFSLHARALSLSFRSLSIPSWSKNVYFRHRPFPLPITHPPRYILPFSHSLTLSRSGRSTSFHIDSRFSRIP